jgi:hypothetical protein
VDHVGAYGFHADVQALRDAPGTVALLHQPQNLSFSGAEGVFRRFGGHRREQLHYRAVAHRAAHQPIAIAAYPGVPVGLVRVPFMQVADAAGSTDMTASVVQSADHVPAQAALAVPEEVPGSIIGAEDAAVRMHEQQRDQRFSVPTQ